MGPFFFKRGNEGRKDYHFCFPVPEYTNAEYFWSATSKCHLPKSGSEMDNALLVDKRHRKVKWKKAMFKKISSTNIDY